MNTIFAGAEVLVKYLDGTTQVVRVRQMPMRHLIEKVIPVIHDSGKLIELCCEPVPGGLPLPDGWIDNLEDESFDALKDKARDLNFSRAMKAAEDALQVGERILPLAAKTRDLQPSSPTAR